MPGFNFGPGAGTGTWTGTWTGTGTGTEREAAKLPCGSSRERALRLAKDSLARSSPVTNSTQQSQTASKRHASTPFGLLTASDWFVFLQANQACSCCLTSYCCSHLPQQQPAPTIPTCPGLKAPSIRSSVPFSSDFVHIAAVNSGAYAITRFRSANPRSLDSFEASDQRPRRRRTPVQAALPHAPYGHTSRRRTASCPALILI